MNTVFSGSTIDRAAHLRDDSAALTQMKLSKTAKAVVLWRGRILVDIAAGKTICWLPLDAKVLNQATSDAIFLGLQDGNARFAFDISSWEPTGWQSDQTDKIAAENHVGHPDVAAASYFVDLRSMMADLTPADVSVAATAKGLIEWHAAHGFCANCGVATNVSKSGWQRHCPSCGRQHFPRTDPVVIMLITHGNDVLLGRSYDWPTGMYSLLAGFMEPGETIAEAVRREVFEEAAIKVGAVDYLADQPWPFPSSLMIGCKGTALTKDITIDPIELESAIWVSKDQVLASMDGQNPALRPARKGSIARFLLDGWLADTLS